MPYDPSALAIDKHLESLDVVRFVEYPGLESHPHHEVAVSQLFRPDSGFGGALSFGLDTDHDGHNRFVSKLNVITSAVSLGHDESPIVFLGEDDERQYLCTRRVPPRLLPSGRGSGGYGRFDSRHRSRAGGGRIRGVRPHRAHDFGLFRPAAAVSESQDGSVTTMAGLLRRHRDNTWRSADDDGTYRRQTASFWTVADTKRRFAVGNGPKTGPITTPTRLSIGTSPFRGPLPTLASCHGTQRR